MVNLYKMTHAELQNNVVKMAEFYGFKCQYWWKSYHSPKGFLDLVLVRVKDKRLIMIEIKIPPDKVRPEQQEWIDTWKQMGIECRVITPKEWLDDTVECMLRGSY